VLRSTLRHLLAARFRGADGEEERGGGDGSRGGGLGCLDCQPPANLAALTKPQRCSRFCGVLSQPLSRVPLHDPRRRFSPGVTSPHAAAHVAGRRAGLACDPDESSVWAAVSAAHPRAVPLDGDARMHRQMETHVRGWGANQGGEAWEWAPFADDDLARCVNLGPYMNAAALTVSEALPLSKALDCLQQVCPPPRAAPRLRVALPYADVGSSCPRPSVVEVCPTNSNRVCWFLIVVLGTRTFLSLQPSPFRPRLRPSPQSSRERDETCPISMEGWTRRVHFVREEGGEGGGGRPLPTPTAPLTAVIKSMSLTIPPDGRRWLYDTSRFWTTRGASEE
jgi:hypothetical protein